MLCCQEGSEAKRKLLFFGEQFYLQRLGLLASAVVMVLNKGKQQNFFFPFLFVSTSVDTFVESFLSRGGVSLVLKCRAVILGVKKFVRMGCAEM